MDNLYYRYCSTLNSGNIMPGKKSFYVLTYLLNDNIELGFKSSKNN